MFLHTGISKRCLLNVSFTKLLRPTGKFLSVLLFPVSSLTSLVLFFSLPAMLRNYARIKRLFFPFIWQVLKQFILLKQALCKLYFHMKLPQLCALHPNHRMHLYTKLPSLQRTAITRQAKWTCTAQLKGALCPSCTWPWAGLVLVGETGHRYFWSRKSCFLSSSCSTDSSMAGCFHPTSKLPLEETASDSASTIDPDLVYPAVLVVH